MHNVVAFSEIGIGDIASVGGKNASLGEMMNALAGEGIKVPDGFATTARVFRSFLRENHLEAPIGDLLDKQRNGAIGLAEAGAAIRRLILEGRFPSALKAELFGSYDALAERSGVTNPAVAVRSSATAEDLPGASFAGQQETYLNVRGKKALLDACRRCFASLFTDRAIRYREIKEIRAAGLALSVGVQLMVRSDLGGSGVMFTIDTETGFPNVVAISASWGLGEAVVQGIVDPDQFLVFKPLLGSAAAPVIGKSLGAKACKIVYRRGASGATTRQVRTSLRDRRTFVLDEPEILQLAKWGARIEAHYGRPMDIEWARDGRSGELFILQARPETVQSVLDPGSFEIFRIERSGPVLTTGAAVGSAVASGRARLVRGQADLERVGDGDVIVASATSPDWLPAMRRAAGIVTEHGGTTSHAAIVSRELGLPAIVGTGDAMAVIDDGAEITLSCAGGDKGIVHSGRLPFTRERIDLGSLPPTRTALMVNMADPDSAFRWWRLPARGVGLARMEFIIEAIIKAHPMAMAHPDRLEPKDARLVRHLSAGHDTPADCFVERLSVGIAKLASTFYPNPAIVRLSDFKTNEYAGLIGGRTFEPSEENPMLGFRGASRYYSKRYADGFALECRALKRVREHIGFSNVIVMVPFCRTLEEADRVIAEMAKNGLRRGEDGLQIYMMCEIPSNVVLAEQFAERFDGFSIGSNDLTQLVLGVDRDSEILKPLFDERDPAVTHMIAEVIAKARKSRVKIGICGQAPSDHPGFADFLVEQGIDSISLNPDSLVRTVRHVARAEASGGRKRPEARSVRNGARAHSFQATVPLSEIA